MRERTIVVVSMMAHSCMSVLAAGVLRSSLAREVRIVEGSATLAAVSSSSHSPSVAAAVAAPGLAGWFALPKAHSSLPRWGMVVGSGHMEVVVNSHCRKVSFHCAGLGSSCPASTMAVPYRASSAQTAPASGVQN